MMIYKPELVSMKNLSLPGMPGMDGKYNVRGNNNLVTSGAAISELGKTIGADAVTGMGNFDDAMLQALDRVSQMQQEPSNLIQQSIIDPDSVDVHDITKAQAEAALALNITRTVLDRIVRGWKEIINTR